MSELKFMLELQSRLHESQGANGLARLFNEAESKISQLENENKSLSQNLDKLRQENEELKTELEDTYALYEHGELYIDGKSLAEHDKETRKEFLSFVKKSECLTGAEKLIVHGLWVKFEQLQQGE